MLTRSVDEKSQPGVQASYISSELSVGYINANHPPGPNLVFGLRGGYNFGKIEKVGKLGKSWTKT